MLPLSENELDNLVARERERDAPPLTDWNSLAAQLRAEGLISAPADGGRFAARRWLQVAAAAVLVAGGAAIGRYTAFESSTQRSPAQISDASNGSGQNGGAIPVGESQSSGSATTLR